MAWSPRLSRSSPNWFRFETALEDEHGVVFEDVRVVTSWSPAIGHRPEITEIGLLLNNARIYALDVKPLQKHTNTAGRGRPMYGEVIYGPHEHTWSDDGYGYVEPYDVPRNSWDVASTWFEFLLRAKIDFPYDFVHPDPKFKPGQQSFEAV